jgi:dTDP-4-amino-4,6-dideoxygalactose transaminase
MANLAVLGGESLLKEPVKSLAWPIRTEETAEKLKQLYMSGEWSFNSPMEQRFEQEFAASHNAKYGIFMANGTVTLECALQALGVKAGDEVIIPALTWMATAMVVHYLSAIPVIVDVEPTTLCMDPAKMEAAITPKTKAIIPVHIYGSTADLGKILSIAEKHGIPVLEDCAQMQGGSWNGKGVGSWGAVGSFSFQQSKVTASGEGGICITNDSELAEKLFLIKHIGYVRGAKQGQGAKTPQGLVCHNYRATAFQALLLSEQLKSLPERIQRYGESARIMTEAIAGVPGVRVQASGRLADPQGYYSFHFIFDGREFDGIDRWTINEACLAEGAGIGNGTHGSVYRHNLFNLSPDQYRIFEGSCPVSDKISCERALGIEHQRMYYRETAEQIGAVVRKVASNVDELRQYAESKNK